MSEVSEKLAALETRVADLKDWKQKYEDDNRKWDEERAALQKKSNGLNALREALLNLLLPLPHLTAQGTGPAHQETLNLNHKELVVNLTHQEKELNLTTGTVMGKVLVCALTDLPREGFNETELSESLKEHGWNVPHNTLAPTLGGLVRDGNLVRVEARPMKYRLPTSVRMNVVGEGSTASKGIT